MSKEAALAATMTGIRSDTSGAGRMRLEVGTVTLPATYPSGGVTLDLSADYEVLNLVTVTQISGTAMIAQVALSAASATMRLYESASGAELATDADLSGMSFKYLAVGTAKVMA